jgi:hypothetical protein
MKYLKPHFFIIGERKCGTSSLYRYLLDHPQVLPCRVKEPQFFTKPLWKLPLAWRKYQALFPAVNHKGQITLNWPELDKDGHLFTETVQFEQQPGINYFTGEASVNTFFAANPRVVKFFLPQVRLIVMLRDPVSRVFSHYRMLERFKVEGRKTQQLRSFDLDMREEMDRVRKGHRTSLIGPSLYIQQLERWWRVFPKTQLLVLRMEDFADVTKAAMVMEEVCTFLGLPAHDFGSILNRQFNKAPSAPVPSPIAEELRHFFEPYNQVLEDRLDRKMNW